MCLSLCYALSVRQFTNCSLSAESKYLMVSINFTQAVLLKVEHVNKDVKKIRKLKIFRILLSLDFNLDDIPLK